MVPRENAMIYPSRDIQAAYDAPKKQTPCCGKQKQDIHKQLLELLKRDSMVADVGGSGGDGEGEGEGDCGGSVARITAANEAENLVPEAPNNSRDLREGNGQAFVLGNEDDGFLAAAAAQQPLQQQAPVSPLLVNMTPSQLHQREDDMLWHSNANGPAVQVTS